MKTNEEDCFHLGVKLLIINPEHKILLLERNHPNKQLYWDLPGGRVKRGESQLDTLIREVNEETGLENIYNPTFFMSIPTNIRINTQNDDVGLIFSIFFTHLSLSFHPSLSEEHTSFRWSTPAETAVMLKPQYPIVFLNKLETLYTNTKQQLIDE